MRRESKIVSKKLKIAEHLKGKLMTASEDIFCSIEPYIENDTNIHDDDIVVDYLAGDGFAFMIGENGVSIDYMIELISDLKKGDKIKLSEIQTYL